MKTSDAIKYAGGSLKLAEYIGVTSGAISQWGEEVPDTRQLQLERMTLGALKASPGCLERVLGMDKLESKAA